MSAHKELPESGDVVIEVNWAKGNLGKTRRGGGGGGGARGKLDRGDEQELRESRGKKKISNFYFFFTLECASQTILIPNFPLYV